MGMADLAPYRRADATDDESDTRQPCPGRWTRFPRAVLRLAAAAALPVLAVPSCDAFHPAARAAGPANDPTRARLHDGRGDADEPPPGLTAEARAGIRRDVRAAADHASRGAGPPEAGVVHASVGRLGFRTTFVNEAKLLPQAEAGEAGGTFGAAVSVDGDTLVVASTGELGGSTAGTAHVFERVGEGWALRQELVRSDAASDDRFGASVSIRGDTIVVGAPFDDTGAGNQAGSAYVFVREGSVWAEQQKLTAPNGAAGDRFGWSVALDGETVVVGAPRHDTAAGSNAGSALVFVRSGTLWSEQQQLVPSGSAANQYFGRAAAISGDSIVIGGNAIVPNASSAHVFVRSGQAWTEQQKLLAWDGTPVGDAVAIDGDTVVTGEPFDITGGPAAGAAHVFVRVGTVWSEQQRLLGAPLDLFGRSVSIDGDTAMVGADQGSSGLGAAYVFVRSGSLWTEQQKLVASDGGAGDLFGTAVSVSGDTAVIGAPADDSLAGPDSGSAYVFGGPGGLWSEQQKLTAPPRSDGTATDRFGESMAMDGDTLVVGAPADETTFGTDAGSAYVFVRSGTVWSLEQKIYPPPDAVFSVLSLMFGFSVSLSGDTLVVGGMGDTFGRGAAWVFVRSGGVWTEQQKLTASDGVFGDGFGSVSVSGDTIVVGAAGDEMLTGAAYVFVRSGGAWSEQQKLTASDPQADAYFGAAVSVGGDTAVVGAYFDDTAAASTGSAYVFTRSGSTWSEQQKLVATDATSGSFFGWSLSLDGDTLVIGAPRDNTPAGAAAGSAYVFVRSGGVWGQQQKLLPSGGAPSDEFGRAVSIDGETAVAGALGHDGPAGSDAGAAYVFQRSGALWSEVQALTAPDAAALASFGSSVSVRGATVAAGAVVDGDDGQGAAYVFRRLTATDVGVAMTDGQATAVPGLPLTYALTVTDAGPDPGVGVRVTDLPPLALTDVSWACTATPGSACPASGSGPIDHLVNLDVNGTLTYSLTGTVAPSATGSLVNTVAVAAPAGVADPDPADDSATDSDTLTPETDLSVGLLDSRDPVRSESTLTYTVQATNTGPSDSTGMSVTGTLPPETSFLSSTPGAPACGHAGGTVTCVLAGLAPGSSQAVTVEALAHPGTLGTIVGSASVSGNETDPVSSNDSASETTQVFLRDGELAHGSVLWADLGAVIGLADQDDYRIGQKPFASYEVVLDGVSGDLGGQGPDLERVASDGVTVMQSSVAASAGSSRSLRWENPGATAANGEYVRVTSAGCTVACGVEDVYRLRAFETTLRVTRFNNSASQVTLLVVQNPGSPPVAGHVRFWSPGGALMGTHAFALGSREALVLDTTSVPGVAGQSGSITVSHDGPYGVLSGKAVAVEPATGFTFDSPLESWTR